MLPLEHHTLVLEVDPRVIVGAALPGRRLRRVAELLVLLFGPSARWCEKTPSGSGEVSRLVTDGVEDLVDGVLKSMDPALVLGGVRRVDLPTSTSDQLETLLRSASLSLQRDGGGLSSSSNSSSGGGSSGSSTAATATTTKRTVTPRVALLAHGCRSVLHSTIPARHLQHLMTFLQLRPLRPFLSTTTPVFHEPDATSKSSGRAARATAPPSAPPPSSLPGTSSSPYAAAAASKAAASKAAATQRSGDLRKWFQMVVLQVQRGVLVGEFPIDTEPKYAARCLEELQHRLYESCDAILPSEEPPVPLHLFVGHEVVGFAVCNRKTSTSLVPNMRPGPKGEATKMWNLFWWFLGGALEAWRTQPALQRIVLVEGDIAFHALRTDEAAVAGSGGGGGGSKKTKKAESVDVFLMASSSATDEDVQSLMERLGRR